MRLALATVILVALALLTAGQVAAAPLVQVTDTPTPTTTPVYTPTPTPPFETSMALTSGAQLVIDRTWTFGELAIFLMLVVLAALYGLHWIYEFTHQVRQ